MVLFTLLACGQRTKPVTGDDDDDVEDTGDLDDCDHLGPSDQEYDADFDGVTRFIEAWCEPCHTPAGVTEWSITDELLLQQRTGQTTQSVLVRQGDPDGSLLWQVLEGAPDTTLMPYNGQKLPCSTRIHVRRWIEAGASVPPHTGTTGQTAATASTGQTSDTGP